MGSITLKGKYPEALLLQEAFLGSWYSCVSLGPQKPFTLWLSARLGQVLAGGWGEWLVSKSPQARPPPQPLSPPGATLQNDRGPCSHQKAGTAFGLPTPRTRLGPLICVQDQGADFWDVTAGSQDGPEPSPCSEAQTGQKAQVDGAPGRAHMGRKETWGEPLGRPHCPRSRVSLAS